jgi:hypothetical protein
VFNIYVNGHYHASVRYSQLRSLHDQLQSQLGYRVVLPAFPPKRIRTTLNDAQLDDRRVALQAYFQAGGWTMIVPVYVSLFQSFNIHCVWRRIQV